MVLEKTLESPLDSKETKPVNPKGNQPWIFIRRTDVGTEAPILWPPDARADSLEKTLMLGKTEGRRRRGWQRRRWLNGITDSMDMNLRKLQEAVKDKEVGCVTVHGVAKNQTGLSNRITTTTIYDVEHLFIFLFVICISCQGSCNIFYPFFKNSDACFLTVKFYDFFVCFG